MPRGVMLTLIAVHALAMAVLIAAIGWTHDKPRPCLKTFERVRNGMTREEVESIVGPPGDYRSPDGVSIPRYGKDLLVGEKSWMIDDATLRVGFSNDDVAQVAVVSLSANAYRTPLRMRLWSWVTTGYDVMPIWANFRGSGPYDLEVLRKILHS